TGRASRCRTGWGRRPRHCSPVRRAGRTGPPCAPPARAGRRSAPGPPPPPGCCRGAPARGPRPARAPRPPSGGSARPPRSRTRAAGARSRRRGGARGRGPGRRGAVAAWQAPDCRYPVALSPLPPPMSDSPLPDDALAHSARLQALIREQIAAAGGAIPFWRFMELALYAPGLGYSSAGATKFGAAGDFVTAPQLGPLFAECVAWGLGPALRALGRQARCGAAGAGSGRAAAAGVARRRELDAMAARCAILEPSADLRDRQQGHLQATLPAADFARVEWLEGPM